VSSEREPAPAGTGRCRADAEGLALLHRTLAELCRSEVPLPRALRVLEADLDRGALKDAVRALAADVEAGVPLATAYAARHDVFPPTYRALVEAGIAAGDLPSVLDEVASHAEREAEARGRMRRALAPTLLSAIVVLLVGTAALGFAVPKLWSFAESTGASSPAPLAFGALGLVLLLVVGGAVVAMRRAPAEGSLAFAVPVLGPIRRDGMRSTVVATLALLVRRRLPLATAFDLAAATAAHGATRARLGEAAARAREGTGLGDALAQTQILEPAALWLVRTSEEAHQPERGLEDVARLYRRRLERRLDRFALLVRPAADLILGIAVFGLAFSYLVPLFQYSFRVLNG
jgi:general secretion pathway protein F